MSKGKKPVLEVATPPQMRLFDGEESDDGHLKTGKQERKFRNPNPRDIYLGGRRLDEYLEEVGQEDPFLIRGLMHSLDLSAFEANYAPTGRAPYAPAAMLGLILWGLLKGSSSLRELERLARTDLACMWICGGIAPEFSVIGKFIRRHHDLLENGEFFTQVTAKILKCCDSEATTLAGDGSVMQAAVSSYKKLDEEAAQKRAEEITEKAADEPDNEELQRTSEQAEKTAQKVKERAQRRRTKGKDPSKAVIAPGEPDAYVQRLKKGGTAPSYKPSILANKDRIIVGHAVDPSSEKKVVEKMVEQAEEVRGGAIKQLMLDGNYFAASVLSMAVKKNIDVLVPDGKFEEKAGDEVAMYGGQFHKSEFAYEPVSDTVKCPAGHQLVPKTRGKPSGTQPAYVQYGGGPCGNCELRSKCTSAKNGRTIKRYVNDELKDAQRQVMSHPKARQQYRHRQAWVEPVFSELRGIQGLNRFRRKGLEKVKAEFSLHAVAHNIRRMVKILESRAKGLEKTLRRTLYWLQTTLIYLWVSEPSESPAEVRLAPITSRRINQKVAATYIVPEN